MSSPLDERLRRALAQQADTTTTAPDGWQRVQARLDRAGRLRRAGFVRWAIVAPVAAVTAVALIVVAVLLGGDGDRTVQVTGGPGRLYLAPTGVEGRFRLITAETDPATDPQTSGQRPGIFRAFGRRAADGVALEASAVIVMPSDFALQGAELERAPLPVLGRDVTVSTDRFGLRILSWTQADGQTVAVMTFGLSDGELAALAESLLPRDAARDAPVLPAGFTPVHSGSLPGGALRVTVQTWEADDGDTFMVSVADLPGVTVDDLAWYLPGGRATEIRGTTGVYSERQDAELVWIERPGAVVTVHGIGISERDIFTIAEGLRAVSEEAWRELTAQGSPPGTGRISEPVGSAKTLTEDNSYFVIRPIQGRFMPPPRSAELSDPTTAPVVPETRGGQEACVRLGPPLLAADDVSTATARQGRASGEWEVEFTLSKEGVARFDALFRTVGQGGEIAILVDGRLVSAPRLASPSAPAKGVVTGLDEQTARHLADRLRP